MKTIFPAASACLVVALVASVSYAETQLESSDSVSQTETKSSTETPVEQAEESETSAQTSETTSDHKSSKKSELSVAPLVHVTYPDDRPIWIKDEPDFSSDVHTWVVTTSGCEAVEDCEAELNVMLRAAVALYIKDRKGWVCGEDFLDDAWIQDDLIDKRYVGTLKRGDQTMTEIAARLAFDADAQQRIEQAWREHEVNDRLRATGGLFALALIGLCCSGGLLGVVSRRFD